MKGERKTKKQLLKELVELRRRAGEPEPAEARRELAEGRQELATRALELLNAPSGTIDAIRGILLLIKEFSGFEAVGIRLREGEDFPYYETNGFPDDFVEAERNLCARDQAGEPIRDSQGSPVLECMCGNIIRGRTDPSLPFFTEGGSFWSNCTTELLASTTEEDRQARTRNRCNGEGYESVALIPLRSGTETIGLLQLNDRRKGMFSPESIAFHERLGSAIGIALARRRAGEGLRKAHDELEERVGGRTAELAVANEQLRAEIAERRQVEQALLKAAQEWRTTFDAIGDAVCLLDAEGAVLRCNRAMASLLGKPFAEIIGGRCCELVHGASGRISGCPFERMKEARRREGAPIRINERWFDVGVDPLLDDAGNVVGAVHIMADITERKGAEEALRESEIWFRSLLEKGTSVYAVVDTQGKTLYESPSLERVYGWKPEEIVGKSIFDLVHPDDVERAIQSFGELLQNPGVEKTIQVRYRHKDGSWRVIEVTGVNRLGDPAVGGVVLTSHDITDGKLAEEALRESEERYRDLVETTGDLVQSVAPDGSIVYVNRAWRKALGYGEEEARGLSLFDIIHPESRAHCMEMFRRVIGGKEAENVEAEFVAKDGTTVMAEGSVSCRLVDGKPVATYGIFHDVTEHRRLEEQLRQSQKMEAVGRLAGGVAHDFNNLMTIVTGYSDLALKTLDEDAPLRRDIEAMKKAGERAAGLTRQLLAFSRRQILQPKVLDINAVVADVEKMLRRLIGEDVDLVTALDPQAGRVKADPGQIEQVIMNLAINARDAMPKGGKLTIETRNVELDEGYARGKPDVEPGPYVLLAISDTGVGMDQEVLSHIFEPFFTTKKEGKGTGLGLATVYGIVRQHNGHITACSEPGRGTTFKACLPLLEVEIEPEEAAPAATELPPATGTVLLVEDEEVVRKVARRMLEMQGYAVLEAADGEEALRVCEEHEGTIRLVITDVVMPGMSGRELAENVKARHPGMKVLYMSGYTDDAITHHGVLEPGTPFIGKPFTPNDLARKVDEVLRAPREEGQ